MDRTWTIALLGVLAAVGCENMGLDDAGPADEARQRSPSELVAAVTQPAPEQGERALVVAGRLWVPAGTPVALDEAGLRPVGSSAGQTVYARGWDRPPYGELFTRLDDEARDRRLADRIRGDGWQAYLPVVGGDVPAPPTDS